MVKLTEVEDEHFTDKPVPTKGDALLVSDDEEDYTDTGKCSTNTCFFSPFGPFECAYCIAPGLCYHHPFKIYQFESTCPKTLPPNQTGQEPSLRKTFPQHHNT